MELTHQPEPTAWQRWRTVCSYPWLWMGIYALWDLFAAVLVLVLMPPMPWLFQAAAIGAAAVLPFLLLFISDRTYRAHRDAAIGS